MLRAAANQAGELLTPVGEAAGKRPRGRPGPQRPRSGARREWITASQRVPSAAPSESSENKPSPSWATPRTNPWTERPGPELTVRQSAALALSAACLPLPGGQLLHNFTLILRQTFRSGYRLLHVLHWSRPGEVWAMDHTEPLCRVDGLYRYILNIRDLASGMQLAWLPMEDQSAAWPTTRWKPCSINTGRRWCSSPTTARHSSPRIHSNC